MNHETEVSLLRGNTLDLGQNSLNNFVTKFQLRNIVDIFILS